MPNLSVKKTLMRFVMLCAAALPATAQSQALPPDAVCPEWENEVPVVIHPDTAMVRLYYTTWKTAAGRVRRGPAGLPASPYLDENCYDDQVWIWDTCFMTLFTKYCPSVFPGKESMLNCYVPILDHKPTPLKIHLRDNPPLFPWVEEEYYRFTGDERQARMVAQERRYLQRHFEYFDTVPKGQVDTLVSIAYNPIHRGVVRDSTGRILGYTWAGNASGMDNTVRGDAVGGRDSILWVDAISQQALGALRISRLAKALGDKREARRWQLRYDSIRDVVNRYYWDERDGYYYDISVSTHEPCRVMTPASFWAMLAEIPSPAQAARMVRYLRDEKYMGGRFPWNSLSRSDPHFDAATGDYWRGGVWLPIAYMGTKALERYGYYGLADTLAERVVRQQMRTWQQYEPHTIWETYSPSADLPSTEWGHRVRPDFCGWSALGPISLFIENIMGFRQVDAPTRTIVWDIKAANGTHGLERLRFGGITCSLVYDAAGQQVKVTTDRAFTLVANGKRIKIKRGVSSHALQARD